MLNASAFLTEGDRPGRSGYDVCLLDRFVGDWRVSGRMFESPLGSACGVEGVQMAEWLAGDRFLLTRTECMLGAKDVAWAEITGKSDTGHGYRSHAFHSDGERREWKLGVRDGVWIRTHDEHFEGRTLRLRCLTSFPPNLEAQTSQWEYSHDGETWTVIAHVDSRRVA